MTDSRSSPLRSRARGHDDPGPIGSRGFLFDLGAACARNARPVIGIWLVGASCGLLLLPHLLGSLDPAGYGVDDSESARAQAAVIRSGPQTEEMLLVFHSERLPATDASYRATVKAVLSTLRTQPGVRSVQPLPLAQDPAAASALRWPYRDPRNAYALVAAVGDDRARQARVPTQRSAIEMTASRTSGGRVAAFLIGPTPTTVELEGIDLQDAHRAQTITFALVLITLLIGLGTLASAALPLLVTLASVAVALGIFALVSGNARFDVFLVTTTAVFGLSTGVDYTLVLVARFREELAAGARPETAAGRAVSTAGGTVLLSGLAVITSVGFLAIVRSTIFREMAAAIIIVVTISVTAAVTLLPAVLACSRRWLEWGPRLGRRGAVDDAGVWARWARHLSGRPWPYLIGAAVLLGAAAEPALGLRTGLVVDRQALSQTASGDGLAVVEGDSFAGALGPVLVAVQWPSRAVRLNAAPLLTALRADAEVARATAVDNGRDLTVVTVVPRVAPDSPAALSLVSRIRGSIAPRAVPDGYRVLVGGGSAIIVDYQAELAAKLPWIVALMLATSFLTLLIALRSLLLPVKAILMTLLGVGASLGLLVVVFQNGWLGGGGRRVILAYMPALLFTILFGLSMDYEIFLVRRMQEVYRRTHDDLHAVADGLQRTAGLVTTAAAVMVLGFAPLLIGRSQQIRQLGFAVAAAIVIDASVIRLVLVPALMRVLGRWNWWLPPISPGGRARATARSGPPPVEVR